MKLDVLYDATPGQRKSAPAATVCLDGTSEDALIRAHLPIVRSVVNRMRSRLPASADLEELHSIGVTGLMSAVKRFDAKQAITFRAYASTRIRGAILDELRRMDSLPRTRRTKMRALNAAVEELEQALGRTPRDEELARKLELSLPELYKFRDSVRPNVTVSLDSPVSDDGSDSTCLHDAIADDKHVACHEQLEKRELVRLLGEHVESLPERMRQVVSMYYFEQMRLADIAEIFGVTEARVCQIHTQAVAALRNTLSKASVA